MTEWFQQLRHSIQTNMEKVKGPLECVVWSEAISIPIRVKYQTNKHKPTNMFKHNQSTDVYVHSFHSYRDSPICIVSRLWNICCGTQSLYSTSTWAQITENIWGLVASLHTSVVCISEQSVLFYLELKYSACMVECLLISYRIQDTMICSVLNGIYTVSYQKSLTMIWVQGMKRKSICVHIQTA